MNYWPTSRILAELPLNKQKNELASLGKEHAFVSESTLVACHNAASKLPACTSLVLVCSENVPMRRVYLEYPTDENWIALERGGFVTAFNNFGFIMDALH